MKLRNLAVLAVLTASALMSTVSTAFADPFLFGTANADGHEIFKYDLGTNTKSTVLDTTLNVPGCSFANFCTPDSLVFDSLGRIVYTMENKGELHRFTPGVPGSDQTLATGFVTPKDLVLAPDGLSVYLSEAGGGAAGHFIDRVVLCPVGPCTVTKLNGGLPYSTSDGPHGLAFVGANLYANIGDRTGGAANSHLAQLDPTTGLVLANQTGNLNSLDGLSFDFDPAHSFLYATSVSGGFVYEFNPAALAAGPTRTLFSGQFTGSAIDGLTYDLAGNLYIAGFSTNASASKLYQCGIPTSGNGTCTGLANILGIDDLAPFNQSNRSTVPEPASLMLLASGLLGLARYRQRKSR